MTVAFVAAVHESLTGTNQANRVGLTMSVDRVDDDRQKVKTLPVVPSSLLTNRLVSLTAI